MFILELDVLPVFVKFGSDFLRGPPVEGYNPPSRKFNGVHKRDFGGPVAVDWTHKKRTIAGNNQPEP